MISLQVFNAYELCGSDRKFLKEFIIKKTDSTKYYPKIVSWLNDNVFIRGYYKKIILATTQDNEKLSGWVHDDSPVGLAIVKLGKICHCSVSGSYMKQGIGAALFGMALREACEYYDTNSYRVRFTLPEIVWEENKDFFRLFGFNKPVLCNSNYRPKIKELRCERRFKEK